METLLLLLKKIVSNLIVTARVVDHGSALVVYQLVAHQDLHQTLFHTQLVAGTVLFKERLIQLMLGFLCDKGVTNTNALVTAMVDGRAPLNIQSTYAPKLLQDQ
uniref:Uncharacterized protein n=1 Tax=Arion vulgaris TaxID=1028688 RepID=A0A0B7B5K4_9EUPU